MTVTLKLRRPCLRFQLRRELRSLRQAIAAQDRALGELTYAAHCGDLSGSAALPGLLASLDGLYAQLEERRRQLDQLRGALICPACGASNAPRNIYCGGCGRPLGA